MRRLVAIVGVSFCLIGSRVESVNATNGDVEAPVVTLNGEPYYALVVGEVYEEHGAVAVDGVDGEVEVTIEGILDTSQAGQYTLIYTATDKSGNTSTVNRIIEVTDQEDTSGVLDKEAPVITLNGEVYYALVVGEVYEEHGAVAMDNIDGEVEVTIEGVVDTTKAGQYIVTYTASDEAGNVSVVERVIEVVEEEQGVGGLDKEAPVITLNGEVYYALVVGEVYEEHGAVAMDNIDGEVEVTIECDVDTSQAGQYIVTYTASDEAGNVSVVERVIEVVEEEQGVGGLDKEAPVITLNGEVYYALVVGEVYEEHGAVAMDNIDGEVEVTVEGVVDTTKAGQYIVTYTASDQAGNVSTVDRVIDVVQNESEVEKPSVGDDKPVTGVATNTLLLGGISLISFGSYLGVSKKKK